MKSILGSLLSLFIVVVFFAAADSQFGGGQFVSMQNLRTVAVQTSPVAVAALGMTVIIIAGGIDLSAGTALALTATVLAWCLNKGYSPAASVLAGVLTGCFCGAINGWLIALLRVVPFIVTLGTMTIYLGAAKMLAKETTVRPPLEVIPSWLPELVAIRPDVYDATYPLLLPVVLFVVLPLLVMGLIGIPAGAAQMVMDWKQRKSAQKAICGGALAIAAGCVLHAGVQYVWNAAPSVPLTAGLLLGICNGVIGLLLLGLLVALRRSESSDSPSEWTWRPLAGLLGVSLALILVGAVLHALAPNVIAPGVTIALQLALALGFVLHYTVFGRHVFALGSNEATARLCGINVPLTKVAVYTLGGFFIGTAGMYQFARLSSGNPTSGLGLELKVIAAVVIGGGSLSGGQGSVIGTLTGAAIMGVIASGCTQLGLRNPVQDIIIGLIIVAAVAVDQFRQRRVRGEG